MVSSFNYFKCLHGLQVCLFKYITVAALHIYARHVKMSLKGEAGGHALYSHGNYIVDHGKNHGIVFLNFCGNPDVLKINIPFLGHLCAS